MPWGNASSVVATENGSGFLVGRLRQRLDFWRLRLSIAAKERSNDQG